MSKNGNMQQPANAFAQMHFKQYLVYCFFFMVFFSFSKTKTSFFHGYLRVGLGPNMVPPCWMNLLLGLTGTSSRWPWPLHHQVVKSRGSDGCSRWITCWSEGFFLRFLKVVQRGRFFFGGGEISRFFFMFYFFLTILSNLDVQVLKNLGWNKNYIEIAFENHGFHWFLMESWLLSTGPFPACYFLSHIMAEHKQKNHDLI